MKIYMGIDPGKKGGIAAINENSCVLYVNEMPLLPNKEVDIKTLVFDIDVVKENYGDINICFLEKAQAMSKQGVTSMFNYGKGYGMLMAMLEIFNVPFQEIHPMKWKKHFALIKTTKEDSISLARKLFPNLDEHYFVTKRGRKKDGIAEALLIAEFCRRSTNG